MENRKRFTTERRNTTTSSCSYPPPGAAPFCGVGGCIWVSLYAGAVVPGSSPAHGTGHHGLKARGVPCALVPVRTRQSPRPGVPSAWGIAYSVFHAAEGPSGSNRSDLTFLGFWVYPMYTEAGWLPTISPSSWSCKTPSESCSCNAHRQT